MKDCDCANCAIAAYVKKVGLKFCKNGHAQVPANQIRDRKHTRCRLCQNAANERARAKRLKKLELDFPSAEYHHTIFGPFLKRDPLGILPKPKKRRKKLKARAA